MTSWQKTFLLFGCMALVVVCRLSRVCAENSGGVEHLAYVIVGAIFGGEIPGRVNKSEKNEQA